MAVNGEKATGKKKKKIKINKNKTLRMANRAEPLCFVRDKGTVYAMHHVSFARPRFSICDA